MKTITELSGITMRRAAAAIAEAKRSLPKVEAPAAVAVEEAPPAPAEAAPAPAEGEAAPAAPAVDAAPAAPVAAAPKAPSAPRGRPVEEAETEAVKAVLDAAVTAATGLEGDRLARLRDAVRVAGGQIQDVRLVRVFGPEEPVPGARTLNGFQYLVDVAPASMRQVATPPKKERGGRGGGGGGGKGAGGSGGKGAPTSGGFSMDSLKDDRKGQPRGPGGGGRGRPGGGSR